MKTKIKHVKQILSALLCIVLMLTYMPIATFAAEGSDDAVVSVTIGGTTENYTTFEDAIEVLEATTEGDNAILTLLEDVNLGEDGIIFESGVFTLELNGYTLSSDGYTLDARGATNICIKDSSEAKTGTILTTESSCTALAAMGGDEDVYPTVTLESGTIEGERGSVSIWDGHFILKGGTVLTGEDGIAISIGGEFAGGKLTVTGGDIFAGHTEFLYYCGEVDLTNYAKTNGLQMHFDSNAELGNIKLPEGYVMLNDVGNAVDNLERGEVYTIGAKPTTTYYPIWIGDEQVADNKTSGDGWSYDLEQNILTLNDFSYTGKGHTFSYGDNASVIFAEFDALTILLKGENNLVHQLAGNTIVEESYGIYVCGDLTIKGDGSLTVQSADIEEISGGISAGEITIEGCTVTAKSGEAEESYAVDGYATITIRDAIVNAQSADAEEKSIGINAYRYVWNSSSYNEIIQDINIINSTVTSKSGTVSDEEGKACAIYGNLSVSGYSNGYEWKVSEDGEYSLESFAYNGGPYLSVKSIYTDDIEGASKDEKPLSSPETGDNSNLWLWFVLLIIGSGSLFTLTVVNKKRKA